MEAHYYNNINVSFANGVFPPPDPVHTNILVIQDEGTGRVCKCTANLSGLQAAVIDIFNTLTKPCKPRIILLDSESVPFLAFVKQKVTQHIVFYVTSAWYGVVPFISIHGCR